MHLHYLALVAQTLGSKKVESIALVLHGTPTAIHISGKDEKVIMQMIQSYIVSLTVIKKLFMSESLSFCENEGPFSVMNKATPPCD